MSVQAAGSVAGNVAASSSSNPAAAGASGNPPFSKALGDQQRRVAARDVLAAMPPMAAEQILKGRPVGGVSELFTVLKSGEFVPNAEQVAAHGCLIATTARAAEVFETPTQMWDTMREMLRAPGVTDAVQHAMALRREQSAVSTPAQLSQTEAIFGGVIPLHQTNWWEIAIQFLLPGTTANATNGTDASSG